METIVVTRHAALVEYLENIGIIPVGAPVISHATADDVKGKHVIGVLPLSLAALAESVTEFPLNVPADMRGKELSLAEVVKFAGKPATYKVTKTYTFCQ